MTFSPFTFATVRVTAGIGIWALHFAVIYGFTAIACARGFGDLVAPVVLVATWSALLALGISVCFALQDALPLDFERTVTAGVGVLAAIAIVLESIPVLIVSPCG